jgi:hypothetical protein
MAENEAARATVADRLAVARRRQLIGRDTELALAGELLTDAARQVVALFLHGPGGVGKSSLLAGIADLATAHAREVVLLDGADLEASPGGLVDAIREVVAAPAGQPLREVVTSRTVLLIDSFEALSGLEAWMRSTLVPSFPDGALLVAAGRRPPAEGWRSEPGWRDLVRVVALRNLDPAASGELLRARGVPPQEVDDLVRVTFGHPLALVVAADVVAQHGAPSLAAVGPSASSPLAQPDAAVRLLARFVDEVDDPRERAALHLCGHARRVDLAMLRRVLIVDDRSAESLFAWLRVRPYVTVAMDGLHIHEVVRDALDADLRWRDHDAFVGLHGRIRQVIVDRAARQVGREQQRTMADLLFLHRGNPLAARFFAYDQLGSGWSRQATASDRAMIVEVVGACEGEERAEAVDHWLRLDPAAFRIHEDGSGEVRGAIGFVRLDEATPADRAADPVAAAVWDELLPGRRPPEAHEAVLYSPPGAERGAAAETFTTITDLHAMASLIAWSLPRLGWAVLTTTREALWGPMWTYIGFERLGEVAQGGRLVGIWGRDFGRSPFGAWLDQLGMQEIDVTGEAPGPVAAPLALSRPDFDAAVRHALKDLHRPDRLVGSPLVVSRLVARDTPDVAAALAGRIRQAADLLADDPRDERGRRALDRTYLRPAASQEAAAELLGLPFSTYRRHLGEGIERVTALLWSWELQGPPA